MEITLETKLAHKHNIWQGEDLLRQLNSTTEKTQIVRVWHMTAHERSLTLIFANLWRCLHSLCVSPSLIHKNLLLKHREKNFVNNEFFFKQTKNPPLGDDGNEKFNTMDHGEDNIFLLPSLCQMFSTCSNIGSIWHSFENNSQASKATVAQWRWLKVQLCSACM